MATPYTNDVPISTEQVTADIESSELSLEIKNAIIELIPATTAVKVASFTAPLTSPSQLKGVDVVIMDSTVPMALNTAKADDLRKLDAVIFTGNTSVALTMDGATAKSFTGVVVTNAGDDIILLSSKSGATVSSSAGNDIVKTGSGDDSVVVGDGNDSVDTGGGSDTVSTGIGNDTVNTGAGADTVFVDGDGATADNKVINTGDGNDTVQFSALYGSGTAASSTDKSSVDGGAGKADILDLSGLTISSVTAEGTDVTITLSNGAVINAANFETVIYDTNGAAAGGTVHTVGVNDFINHGFGG